MTGRNEPLRKGAGAGRRDKTGQISPVAPARVRARGGVVGCWVSWFSSVER